MQASWFSKSKIKSKKLKIGLGLDVSVRLAGYDLMITHSSHGLGFLLFHFYFFIFRGLQAKKVKKT